MYTKLLLLFTFLFLLASVSGSQRTSGSNRRTETETVPGKHIITAPHLPNPFQTIPPDVNWPDEESNHGHEEDGKHHHFHFDRLQGRRFRVFLTLLAKLLLLISHIYSLISGILQLPH